MKALRAFVMTQNARLDWTVTIFRDFESLIQACKSEVAGGTVAVVVHVGFDRPDFEAFGDLVSRFCGRLVLTGSARYALGTWGNYASDLFDVVDGLPLHVVLDGWGYSTSLEQLGITTKRDISDLVHSSIPDELAGLDVVPGSQQEEWAALFRNDLFQQLEPWRSTWVREIAQADPDLATTAGRVGIVDDDSYFQLERNLSRDLRIRLGLHRFKVLIRNRRSDPTSIARCCPPWLLEMNVSALLLPTRPSNCLLAACITKIRDLCLYTESDLLKMPALGRKSVADIAKALLLFLEDETSNEEPPPVEAVPTLVAEPLLTKIDSLDNFLRTLSSRNFVDMLQEVVGRVGSPRAMVLRRRMGYGGRVFTLQEIADTIGLTRERVRQIESKGQRLLRNLPIWSELLRPKLAEMLSGRTTPLLFVGLDVLDPLFKDIESIRLPFCYCLDTFLGAEFSVLEINGHLYLSRLSQAAWDEVVAAGRKLLEASASDGWTESHAKSVVANLISAKGEELRDELWSLASHRARFGTATSGERILVAYGDSAEDHISAVLAQSDRPLHFTEIAERISLQLGRRVSDRYTHGACGRCALVYGRGSYGLKKHFPLSVEEANLVVFETEEIIRSEKVGKQWSCDEICDRLAQRGVGIDERLDKYVLNIALSDSKVLAYLGRLVWTLDPSGRLTTAHRIDVRQAIISILERSGRPMSLTEIRDTLSDERGISDVFQVQPTGSLIRIGANMWGLADRDIGVKPAQQKQILEELVSILRTRNEGLHISDLTDVLIETRAYVQSIGNSTALMALAQRDGRMRIGVGQYLYLSTWEGPRRLQISDAVKEILLAAPGGLAIHEVLAKVCVLMGRPIVKESLYGAFRAIGARWDEDATVWKLPPQALSDDLEVDDQAILADAQIPL